jgi:hypothetical protein
MKINFPLKIRKLIFVIIALALFVSALYGCKRTTETTRLVMNQPVYSTVEKVVCWESVENANRYELTLIGNGIEKKVMILSDDKNPSTNKNYYRIDEDNSGIYEVIIIAKGDGIDYADSLKKTLSIDYRVGSNQVFLSENDVLNMSDKQLIEEAYGNIKFPIPDFYLPDDFGVAFEIGEVWTDTKLSSASSVEEARAAVESVALMQYSLSYSIDYIGENEYYYQFRLSYPSHNQTDLPYITRILVYKENAMYCTFNNRDGGAVEIRMLNPKSVTDLLDLSVFMSHYSWRSARAIHRELIETPNEYVYTYYTAFIVHGDWGMTDTACLSKTVVKVNKYNGKIQRLESQYLKQISIPDTHYPDFMIGQ